MRFSRPAGSARLWHPPCAACLLQLVLLPRDLALTASRHLPLPVDGVGALSSDSEHLLFPGAAITKYHKLCDDRSVFSHSSGSSKSQTEAFIGLFSRSSLEGTMGPRLFQLLVVPCSLWLGGCIMQVSASVFTWPPAPWVCVVTWRSLCVCQWPNFPLLLKTLGS